MNTASKIRVGFVGAGAIARSRHLPNLAKIPDVEVRYVSNRSRESAQKIADEWRVPHIVENWRDLIARDDIDAVFIGTWPYMHREMCLAALQAGKHVFCQARMAMNLAEAKDMLAASRAKPSLVAQICPPPTRMPFEPYVHQLISSGKLGQIVSVELLHASGANLNPDAVHWRERREFSGNQIMAMGIYAETLNAWVGPYESLAAFTATPIGTKRDAGKPVEIKVPQAVTISGRLKNGALATEFHLGLAADKSSPGDMLTIWGRAGTLRYTFGQSIFYAPAGGELDQIDVPNDLKRDWHVEEDFIASVRNARAGKPKKVGINPDFAEGLDYMRKVEAVHASATSGRAVKLEEL